MGRRLSRGPSGRGGGLRRRYKVARDSPKNRHAPEVPITSSIAGKCSSITRVSSRRSPRCSRFLRAARRLFPRCQGPFSSSRGPGRVSRSAPGVSCSPRAAGRAPRNRRPSALFALPARGQAPGVPLPSPVLDMGVPEPLFPQQRAPLGAVLGQRVEFRQDPRLVRGGERPPLRLPGLAAGHLTIMPRDRGLVGQCHRHSLRSPSLALFGYRSLIRTLCLTESDRQGFRIRLRRRVDTAFPLWTRRSRVDWSLDLSLLADVGVAVAEPPSARERGNVAGETLRRL